jgi:HPt (histidine-containing phosphotransfer) domain-containing protein
VGGNLELLQDLIRVFRENSSNLVAEIQDALSKNEAGRVSRAAHTLKGMVSFFGADQVTAHTVALEAMSRAGDMRSARPLFADLVGTIECLHQQLRQEYA